VVVVEKPVFVGCVTSLSICVLQESVCTQVAAEDVDDTLMIGALVGIGHVSQRINSSNAHLWRCVTELLDCSHEFLVGFAALKRGTLPEFDDKVSDASNSTKNG